MYPSLPSCFRRHCCSFSIRPPTQMSGHPEAAMAVPALVGIVPTAAIGEWFSQPLLDQNRTMEPNQPKIQALIRQLLAELGEDPDREGLAKTLERVAKALAFLT